MIHTDTGTVPSVGARTDTTTCTAIQPQCYVTMSGMVKFPHTHVGVQYLLRVCAFSAFHFIHTGLLREHRTACLYQDQEQSMFPSAAGPPISGPDHQEQG